MDNINIILSEVRKVVDSAYFEITVGEVLVDGPGYYSMTVGFKPKNVFGADVVVSGKQQYLQFDLLNGDVSLICGEDSLLELEEGNIFVALYWGEVSKVE